MRGNEEDLQKTDKKDARAELKYLQRDEKKIFVSFSLLLDLANQYLRGKEEDLDKTDERESHAESQHSSYVGDERCGRHHLRRKKRVNEIIFSFSLNLVCFIFSEIWGVQKGVDLDQIL